jgi:hypothetical protein
MAVKNHPEFRKIRSAMARDPEGTSRIPSETFQQVMDRMEHDIQSKTIDWSTIVEFFTKRGKPLSREEIKRLQDEDKRIHDEELERKRAQEEADRRRMQRLTEDLEEDLEDEDDYEKRRMEEERKKREDEEDDDDDAYGDEAENNPRRYHDRDGSDEERDDLSDSDDGDFERSDGTGTFKRNRSQRAMGNEYLGDKRLTAKDYAR